ncbi:MAG TPA: energy-coupling factor transporter transmembrane component T [Oscillospiraceae bacterium]|nr:energy-coupling factor transporter transmembrane component T [Oscillospiraceae bacterium]HXK77373.1 energy-coupling factor transporter transmembrane component T [Oscillospiraceae bacterium]
MTAMKKYNETGLARYHPLVSFCYFTAVLGGTLLFIHPLFAGISLLCAVTYACLLNGKNGAKLSLLMGLPMALLIAAGNPLFNHRGATFLFYLRDNPVTLEALAYGAVMGAMLFASVMWFSCYNVVVTSDKFLYIFGRIFPTGALIASMTLKLIPQLLQRVKLIADTQRTLGLDWKSGSLIRRIRSGARILSILVGWALEEAVVTADSMNARGYGSHRRSNFSVFIFSKRDRGLLLCILGMMLCEAAAYLRGTGTLIFYPTILPMASGIPDLLFYAAFLALGLVPIILQIRENRRWNFLK